MVQKINLNTLLDTMIMMLLDHYASTNDSKNVYGDDEIYIKIKIKTYSDSVITNFYNKKISKRKRTMQVLSIIIENLIDDDLDKI